MGAIFTSDALELEFDSRAELDILEKRAESELDFLKMIFNFFPRILSFPWNFLKEKAIFELTLEPNSASTKNLL